MYQHSSENADLYVLAYLNDDGEVVGYPMGGGSSTKPSIKAHTNLKSAQRSQRHFPKSRILKATEFEIIEEEKK
jgi:hypothetical protein